jgi:hypothetical protein
VDGLRSGPHAVHFNARLILLGMLLLAARARCLSHARFLASGTPAIGAASPIDFDEHTRGRLTTVTTPQLSPVEIARGLTARLFSYPCNPPLGVTMFQPVYCM